MSNRTAEPRGSRLAWLGRFEVGLTLAIVGIWWLPNGPSQVIVLVTCALWPAWRRGLFDVRGAWEDRLFRGFSAWLAYVFLVTWIRLASGESGASWWKVPAESLNGLLLVGFALLTRRAAGLGWGPTLATIFVYCGTGALAISLVVFYAVQGHPFPGDRLSNVLVYPPRGLHTVLTGLLAAAAAVLASSLHARSPSWKWPACLVLLVTGLFFTYSRGAVLCLSAGLVALLGLAGWRRAAIPVAICVFTYASCAFLAPRFASSAVTTPVTVSKGVTERNIDPARELIRRADGGRFPLYRIVWGRMTRWDQHLFGRGLGADRAAGPPELWWDAPHPHSVFLSIYFASGLLGTALFSYLLAAMAWRAIRHRHAVEVPMWGALLTAGIGGLVFDGDVPAAYWTITRVEPILIWLPWSALSGILAGRTPEDRETNAPVGVSEEKVVNGRRTSFIAKTPTRPPLHA